MPRWPFLGPLQPQVSLPLTILVSPLFMLCSLTPEISTSVYTCHTPSSPSPYTPCLDFPLPQDEGSSSVESYYNLHTLE